MLVQCGARVRAERSGRKYLLDVFVSGRDYAALTFLPDGWLDRVEPALVEPDVINQRNWKDGHLLVRGPAPYDLARARIQFAGTRDQHEAW